MPAPDQEIETAILSIRNHGIVTQGANLAEAVAYAVQFESCAKQQLQLPAAGVNYTLIPAESARDLRAANGSPAAMSLWYATVLRTVMSDVDGKLRGHNAILLSF